MSAARSLRKIETALLALAMDPDPIGHEAVRILSRRVGAQAEWLEEGLDE